ncbi:MAG: hypothetical protein ACOY7J_12680 [Pseudomonadota bacterium]
MSMKHIRPIILASLIGLAGPVMAAEPTTGMTDADLKKMQEHMDVMQKQMQEIQSAKTEEEKKKLMQQHMETMQQHMDSMCTGMKGMGMMHDGMHDGAHGDMMRGCMMDMH